MLLAENRHMEDLLLSVPPTGDSGRIRGRAIYCWLASTALMVAGF
jgi:hypothetical protein